MFNSSTGFEAVAVVVVGFWVRRVGPGPGAGDNMFNSSMVFEVAGDGEYTAGAWVLSRRV
jgi:hypothetical protein